MMRRASALVLGTCVVALLAAGPVRAQGTQLYVWPEPPGTIPGDTIAVQLRLLDSGPAFNAFAVTLHYDPAALQFVPRSRAEQEGADMVAACANRFYRFDASGDSIVVATSLLCNGVSLIGPAMLFDLHFVAIGGEQTTCVRATSAALFDDGLYVLPLTVVDACFPITTTAGVSGRAAPGHAPRLLASPNPARGAVSFALEGVAGGGDVVICDLAGRIVARLPLAASGSHASAGWSGRSDDGRELPAGVYTAVARTARGLVRTRFIRIR